MPYDAPHSSRPLAGVRVADFSRVLAGPSCTRILCDLGAEVVKIEPPEGDLSRKLGSRRGSMSGYFMQQNCGKLNVSIDLKSARGRDLAARIVEHSDVMVENFRPGVIEKLGLGAEAMTSRNPRLVYCSISGFGRSGPWSGRRAFAGIAHATTGILHRQAAASGRPAFDSALAIGDTVTGLQAVIAILAALRARDASGRGDVIDLAMHDSLLAIQEAANFYLFPEEGDETEFLCAWIYPAKDRDVLIPNDPRAFWNPICRAMQRPDLASDPRYDTAAKRLACLPELEAHVREWVAGESSAAAVVEALERAGLPGAVVATMGEALDCEQTRTRGMTPEIDDRSGRHVRVLNTPYRLANAEAGVRGLPAFRGEDNRFVMREILGLPEGEIDALEADEILTARVPGPS